MIDVHHDDVLVAVKENGGRRNKIAPIRTCLLFEVYKLTKVLF